MVKSISNARNGDETELSMNRLEDLAELAGVSISTVSRALNNSPLVSEKTRSRIYALARKHQYQGRVAFSKVAGISAAPVFTLIIPPPQGRDGRLSEPFLLQLMGGIADAAREMGCDLLISSVSPQDDRDFEALIESDRCDGLIVIGQSIFHPLYNRMALRGVPLVVWGGHMSDQAYCCVGSDNLRGGEKATRHLLRQGRQTIAFLGDPQAPEAALRLKGYKDALFERGLIARPSLTRTTHFYYESAADAVDALLDAEPKVDGIVAASDLIALGAINSLLNRGKRVPEDVAVVGYDDIDMARLTDPALTTIRQDVGMAGRLLVAKLLRLLKGEHVKSEMLGTELIVRRSCGA